MEPKGLHESISDGTGRDRHQAAGVALSPCGQGERYADQLREILVAA